MTEATKGKYRLYGRRETGSAASEAVFAEAGVDCELVDVPRDADGAEALTSVNPRGQVPALILPDGTAIAEGTAILLHIADAFPSARLAPLPGSFARAHHDRWLLYFQANVYEGELRKAYPDRYTANPAHAPEVQEAADQYVKRHYAIFEATLGGSDYCTGGELSVLDIYLWMLVQWMDRDWMERHCPKLMRIGGRVALRPAIVPIQRHHFG